MANIAIVGAGMMGTAMAWPLSDNGHAVRLLGTHLDHEIIQSCQDTRTHPGLRRRLPDGVEPVFVEDIGRALDGAEIIVSGVSSMGVRWVGRTMGLYVRPGQTIIAVTKGLEATPEGELRMLPDVLRDELPASLRDQIPIAAIGGPCIAGELAGRRQTSVLFGARDKDVAGFLADIFRTPYYHIRATADLMSLEVCAALKNAYALGVSLAAGLLERSGGPDQAGAAMHNLAATLFAQSCVEMGGLLGILGGDQSLAYGLPGAGDLFVTVQGGRTARLGKLLGSGKSYEEAREILAGETLESVEIVRAMSQALPAWESKGLASPEDFPLLRLLIDIVVRGKRVPAELQPFAAGRAQV